MYLVIRLIAAALGFWAATALISGITVNGGPWSYLWVALLFGLINSILGSIIKLLTLPALLLSLGLFAPEYRGIGIRIEDDILVTQSGAKILSNALPRHPDEVEVYISNLLKV